MSELDRRWHDSFKAKFTADGRFVYRSVTGSKSSGQRTNKTLAKHGKHSVLIGQLDSAKVSSIMSLMGGLVTDR